LLFSMGSNEQQFSNNHAIEQICLNNRQSAQVKVRTWVERTGNLLFTVRDLAAHHFISAQFSVMMF